MRKPASSTQPNAGDLRRLQQVVVATTDETLALIEKNRLYESGCGAVDVALLASVLLTPDALLWTADRKLDDLAARVGVEYRPVRH